MKKIELSGQWILREAGKTRTLKAVVPGEVHLDLKRNKIIPEPLVGDAFVKHKTLEKKNWSYEKSFRVKGRYKKAEIIFEGLDGNSRIVLNGKDVGPTRNAFIGYTFDVTGMLASDNKLQVFINDGLSGCPEKREDFQRFQLRKPQFYFGWDWTGRLINCGIWRPVRLCLYNNLKIRDVQVYPDISGKVRCRVEIENFGSQSVESKIAFRVNGSLITEENLSLRPGVRKTEISFTIKNPELWYPWNMGKPVLYDLEMTVSENNKLEDKRQISFGFRQVEIEQKTISREEGKSFTIKINGIKVFAKGANWVPADTIPARVDKKKYEKLLGAAREMGVNCLRIWGGGIYEDPYFYQLCDKLGIMVWQDFMFACGYYPDDKPEFLREVKEEAESVVRKLRAHPCVVLWCGNNECHHIYFDDKKKKPGKVFHGREIFHKVLPKAVRSVDPGVFYWPGSDYSPSGADPKSMKEGDRHSHYIPYIDLLQYKEKGERYFSLLDRAKFVSEFARPGFSLPQAIRKATGEKKIEFNSKKLKLHLNTFIPVEGMLKHLVNAYGSRVKNLSVREIILLSQVFQGETMNFAISHYSARKFLTSGCLFWMFNDAWPTVSSWTAVDYYLNKTPLFWYAKRAFQDVGVFIKPAYLVSGNKFEVFIWNDNLEFLKYKIEFGISDFSGKKLGAFQKSGTVKPDSSHSLGSFDIPFGLLKRSDLIIQARGEIGGKTVTAYTLLAPNWRESVLPEEKIRVRKSNGNEISLSSNGFVPACILENIETDDNFFPLLPGMEHKVKITEGNVNSLKIRTLNGLLKGNL